MSEYACWCRASYCSRQVPPGSVLCTAHALSLAQVGPELLDALEGLDPRGIESEPASEATVERPGAAGLGRRSDRDPGAPAGGESLPDQGHGPAVDPGPREPAPMQGRLIEDHPDLGGACGPEGRRRSSAAYLWLALAIGCVVGYRVGLARGRTEGPPGWSEVRTLDAWLIGREHGRREVLTQLLAMRTAMRTATNVTARVDPRITTRGANRENL